MNVPGNPSYSGQSAPKEEIRFAVVLNGGVSLAVWMGGVVREIDRVTRQYGPYGRLLNLLNAKARADVIAGTSAGGINGAALALAQANKNADVGLMRDLWSEQGRMDSLLQRPFRGSPASLLRGDDYFLPKIHEAMKQLSKNWEGSTAADRPLELIITTTLLHGARTVTVDSLGQQLPQMLHQGHFTFKRDDPMIGERNDFGPGADDDITAGLAIASRCTASFPVAFEPCFVPAKGRLGKVLASDGQAIVDLTDPGRRPDLGSHVSWRTAGPAEALPDDRSRFAVDGGLLANTPTKAALEAIGRMPASGLVQRVMLLVYPHAPTNQPDPADRSDEPPTVTAAMGGLLGALLSQGNRTFVDEIETHNQAAAARRGTRLDIMEGLRDPDGLKSLAECVFQQYRNQRVRRAAHELVSRVQPPADWSYQRIRKAIESAERDWMRDDPQNPARPTDLPYVPHALPRDDDPPAAYWNWGITAALDLADTALDLLHRLISVTSDPETCNLLAEGRRDVSQARAELLRIRDELDEAWTADSVLTTLPPSKNFWTVWLAHYARAMTNDESMVDLAEAKLRDELRRDYIKRRLTDSQLEERAAGITNALIGLRNHMPTAKFGLRATSAVRHIVDSVVSALAPLKSVHDAVADSAGLRHWKMVFRDLPTEVGSAGLGSAHAMADHNRVHARLLWLHVAAWTLADDSGTGSSHAMDLVQISLQTQNDFAVQSTTLDDKVGGMSLNRFGGFLKRSWRMNDWTWGRMDAATMLCQIILSPERLRRRAIQRRQSDSPETASGFVDTLIGELFTTPVPVEVAELWAAAVSELEPVYSPDEQDLPSSLPNLAAIAAWAVHMRAAVEELPTIAASVAADRSDRANPSSNGELFLTQNASLLSSLDDRPDSTGSDPLSQEEMRLGLRALRAFDRAGIGREPLDEEARSDQMIRTAATAASVAVTLADSGRSGLGAIKPVTRTLRGGMLVPYWTVLGLTAGGAIARFLALMTLASGALLLSLSLLGVIHGWAAGPAAAIGLGAVLTAFGFAAMRTGTLLHSVVLLTPVIPLVVYAADRWDEHRGDGGLALALGATGTILALALALMLLGSLPSQVVSPIATLYRALDRIGALYFPPKTDLAQMSAGQRFGRRLAAAGIWIAFSVLLLAVMAAIAYGLVLLVPWVVDQPPQWKKHPGRVIAIASVAVLIGWMVGYWAGWRLRSWTEVGDGSGSVYRIRGVDHSSGVAATWSVVYGTVFALVAGGIVWRWPAQPGLVWQAALVTALVFALLLLYVVPVVVLLGSVRSVLHRLVKDARCAAIVWPPPEADLSNVINLLWKQDMRYRCLLKPTTRAATTLTLTGAGIRLKKRVTKTLATTP
ncbi:patatin-like protein [Kribbella sp. VKM Ac-2568]|uniref:patatin-like protein n=1 Tax=Kribbella sp. VKM Ac-2568 TaxID=2512219 RepID=UPI00104C28A3|nr:patatin-like protein [Kribbella sp. VKM Ac-2568]TCM44274.1 patatin-related protein [Kribbella sp. VKM Ac-2568]